MKKTASVILLLSMLCFLTACGKLRLPGSATPTPAPTPEPTEVLEPSPEPSFVIVTTPEPTPTPVPTPTALTITIPKALVDQSLATGNYHATELDNGSVRYTVSEEEHEAMLADVRQDIRNELQSVCDNYLYPAFQAYTINEDMTVFTIVSYDIIRSNPENLFPREVFRMGRMYAAYAGNPEPTIHLDVKNAKGELLWFADSNAPDLQW